MMRFSVYNLETGPEPVRFSCKSKRDAFVILSSMSCFYYGDVVTVCLDDVEYFTGTAGFRDFDDELFKKLGSG